MKKRLISLLLVLATLTSLLPQTVLAAEGDEPSEEKTLTIVIDGERVVANGEAAAAMPAGVSYNESRKTLTLDDASLGFLHIRYPGEVTVVLKGDSTIGHSGAFLREDGEEEEPFMIGGGTAVTIEGPGSLTVDASGLNYARALVADFSDVTITGGAEVSVYGNSPDDDGKEAISIVSSDFTVEDAALTSVGGIYIQGKDSGGNEVSFRDCTVNAPRMYLAVRSDGPAPSVTVGSGAVLNLTAVKHHNENVAGRVLDVEAGSRFLIDGGEVHVDTSAVPIGRSASMVIKGDGSLLEVRSGLLEADLTGNHNITVQGSGELLQTGGTLQVDAHGTDAGAALQAITGGRVSLKGGAANLAGRWGVSVHSEAGCAASALTIEGGDVDILGRNGEGISLVGGTFSMLGGKAYVESRSDPDPSLPLGFDAGSTVNLLGGTIQLYKEGSPVVMAGAAAGIFVLGDGMHVVDNTTGKEIAPDYGSEIRFLSSDVTISGQKSVGLYSCELDITSGEVIQGARFTVRAVVSLGAEEGTVSFPLPAGVSYVPGSLTVDSQVVTPTSTSPLTVPLRQGGTIRFSATAKNTGDHTLTANVAAGGQTHRETLPFTVSSFNLSLPSRTARLEIPVAGAAAPGSVITFYEGEKMLGKAAANSLGTWSGTVTLPDVKGEHTVYAVVKLPEGGELRSDDHVIVYEPELDEVKTLTVTNYVHGRTSADPPVAETLVMDFVTGKDSADYFTYWPDLEEFTFRVDFVKDSSAQRSVSVITTNRMGQETEIPLRYKAAEDAWFGSYDYTENNTPRKFRVEFVPGEAESAGPALSGEFTYDDHGNIVRAVYADGSEYSFAYRDSKINRAGSGSFIYQYNDEALVDSVSDDTGELMRISYDDYGCISQLSFADGTYIKYTRNQYGQLISATDGETTCYYNEEFQVDRIVNDEGTTILSYDGDGNVSRMTYPDGTYTAYTYNADGQVTQMTDGGETLTFRYEGDETFMTGSDGVTVSWSPSAVSLDALDDENAFESGRFSLTNPDGSYVVYEGGKDGVTTTVDDGSGHVLSYTCNLEGLVTAMSENGETTTLDYDESNRLTKITYPNGKSVSYRYDAQDRIVLVTDGEGYSAGYVYGAEDRIEAITDGANTLISYSYNADGSLARQDNANGTYTVYAYSGEYVSSIENYGADGKLLSSFAYTYDGAGNVATLTEAAGTWTFSYDGEGQLTRATAPDGTVTSYAYDADGNRTQVTVGDQVTAYTANGENQYTAYGDTTRTYDADGNLLTETRGGKTARYTWNGFGQLISHTDFNGSRYDYGYDAFGLLNRITSDGLTTTFVNDPFGYGMPVASYNSSGFEQHYVAGGTLAAVRQSGQTYYYHSNMLGSVTEITGEGGTVVNQYVYDHEGSAVSSTERVANLFGYAGIYGLMSYGSGLIYDRARFISTATDSFISKDPAGTLYDSNLYRYVGNNPVSNIDITGEARVQAVRGVLSMLWKKQGSQQMAKNTTKKVAEKIDKVEDAIPDNNGSIYDISPDDLAREIAKKEKELEKLKKILYVTPLVAPLGGLPVLAAPSDDGDFTGGAAPIFPDPDDPSGTPSDAPAGTPSGTPSGNPSDGTSDSPTDTPSDEPSGDPDGEVPPWQRAMENPVVELYAWGSWGPAWWIVYPVYGGAYIAEKWPDNPLTKGAGWVGDRIGDLLYPDPDPGEWSDMILDPPPVDPGTLEGMGDPSRGRGPIPDPKLYPWKTQPTDDPVKGRTADKEKDVVEDPSGFVYEGIQSNRLSGVTTTLYFSSSKTKPTANAAESQKWDAAAFDQINPLTTDTGGQYMWMVPDGWWQVKYEKAGYETAYSDWLPVPPVQTEVNVGLVSTAPARLSLSGEAGDDAVVLRFDRPVRLSTVTDQTVKLTRNGAPLAGDFSPVDAAAAGDGQVCATTFYFRLAGGQTLKDGDALSASFSNVMTYAGTANEGNAAAKAVDRMPFADVKTTDYFYDPVLWAVNHKPQITTGTGGASFSPNSSCTRAQAVTFLWRAMGAPEPKSTVNPFTDVQPGAYYYKAVLWAVENGVTKGTSGTTFSPDATCTRGQIVTFLHRTEGKREPMNKANPFTDVSATAYYYDAVLWAVEWGITKGTGGTTFSPDATCTRGQIVTFLYRDMK